MPVGAEAPPQCTNRVQEGSLGFGQARRVLWGHCRKSL